MTCSGAGDSVGRSMETMFGIPPFSVGTDCNGSQRILYTPDARHINSLNLRFADSLAASGSIMAKSGKSTNT